MDNWMKRRLIQHLETACRCYKRAIVTARDGGIPTKMHEDALADAERTIKRLREQSDAPSESSPANPSA